MKAAMRRLRHAEAALLPKQQVLNWLDQALKFGSEERYFQWLRKQPTSELPHDNGRAVIFPQKAATLATAHETAKVLAREAQAIVAAWRGSLCKEAKTDEILAEEETLGKEAAAAALSSVRSMTTLAKAEAYGATDCFEQARAVIDAAAR